MQDKTEELRPRVVGARPGAPAWWLAFAGIVLTVLGLGLWVFYRIGVGDERHSFAPGASAPGTVLVHKGGTYSIGVHGGVLTTHARKVDIENLACEITPAAGATMQLAIAAEPSDTKALDQVATFVSPVSGRVHVDCPGLPAVFVDDAVDAGTDYSGTWLLLASASLAVGLPMLLSVARRPRSAVAGSHER
ncbi:MAG: hypothetical protein ACR2LX_06175 [Jatrophihabitans sp.]